MVITAIAMLTKDAALRLCELPFYGGLGFGKTEKPIHHFVCITCPFGGRSDELVGFTEIRNSL
jgi:hypothetical protein